MTAVGLRQVGIANTAGKEAILKPLNGSVVAVTTQLEFNSIYLPYDFCICANIRTPNIVGKADNLPLKAFVGGFAQP
jgi:hypothetical protein